MSHNKTFPMFYINFSLHQICLLGLKSSRAQVRHMVTQDSQAWHHADLNLFFKAIA